MTNDDVLMCLSLLVLALFASMYGYLFFVSWRSGPLPTFTTQFVFVANSLAATVGTIVATNFGQKLPEAPGAQAPAPQQNASATPAPAVDPAAPAVAVRNAVKIETGRTWRQNVPNIYTITYFVLGFIAIVTWIFKTPPEMVNTLGYITFGLMLNIVRAGF